MISSNNMTIQQCPTLSDLFQSPLIHFVGRKCTHLAGSLWWGAVRLWPTRVFEVLMYTHQNPSDLELTVLPKWAHFILMMQKFEIIHPAILSSSSNFLAHPFFTSDHTYEYEEVSSGRAFDHCTNHAYSLYHHTSWFLHKMSWLTPSCMQCANMICLFWNFQSVGCHAIEGLNMPTHPVSSQKIWDAWSNIILGRLVGFWWSTLNFL